MYLKIRYIETASNASALFPQTTTASEDSSWWGVIAVPLLVAGMVPRAIGEERMLRRELSGYDEYARRVRYRLVPGIW